MFYKKRVLRNYAKYTGKHLCQRLFFNKVAGLRSATLLKKRLRHRCFPVNLVKFLRTNFLQNTSGRLLLFTPLLRLGYNYDKKFPFSFHRYVHFANIFLRHPTSTYFAHYVTNLSKKYPSDIFSTKISPT